jgi:2-methylisocitrate lyase-like PEP mutase family enzyme
MTGLKERLERRDAMLLPGASNALAARIIEDLGFEAVYVTGAGVTNAYLGKPDLGFLTLTELMAHVGAMREVVSLPIIVDADTGFGNALNVVHTVRCLERTGANAIQIEDQESPKRCGHFAGKRVIAAAEMCQKIRAAVDARLSGDFLIIARTDALQGLGIEEALARAEMYAEAGADLTFVEAPRNRAEMEQIPRRLPVPQVSNMVPDGLTPQVPLSELAAMGYAVVLYPNAALQAGIAAMQRVLGHLKAKGDLIGAGDLFASFAERQRLVGKPAHDRMEKEYATPQDTPATRG